MKKKLGSKPNFAMGGGSSGLASNNLGGNGSNTTGIEDSSKDIDSSTNYMPSALGSNKLNSGYQSKLAEPLPQ